MSRVVIESPYGADPERFTAYARRCMADSLARGEAPLASHLLYTQPGILDDTVPEERAQGIEAGLEWARFANASVFYVDHGWSAGMISAQEAARQEGRRCIYRAIGRDA